MEAKAARIRVGGGWLIAPQVPGLKDGGLNENEALELLASANTAGCLGRDGDVEYLGPGRPGSAPPQRPTSPTSPKPPTSPRGRPKSSQRRGGRWLAWGAEDLSQVTLVDVTDIATCGPDLRAERSRESAEWGPNGAGAMLAQGMQGSVCLSGACWKLVDGPMRLMRHSVTSRIAPGPALGFKQLEEERRNLSERISNGQGKAPSSGPRGFIIGTFVQGSHDKHRLSSDTGPRTMYRVYRSGITADSAMDTSTLEKTLGARCGSRARPSCQWASRLD